MVLLACLVLSLVLLVSFEETSTAVIAACLWALFSVVALQSGAF